MRKEIIIFILVVFIFTFAVPVKAESVFNEAAKCIATWGKPCEKSAQSAQCAPAAQCAPSKTMCFERNAIGEKVPVCTMKSGNISSGKIKSAKDVVDK